jgi:hypothetical protein
MLEELVDPGACNAADLLGDKEKLGSASFAEQWLASIADIDELGKCVAAAELR